MINYILKMLLIILIAISLSLLFLPGCSQIETIEQELESVEDQEPLEVTEMLPANNTVNNVEVADPETVTTDESTLTDFEPIPWNSGTYTGFLKEGKPDGKGSWISHNGDAYIGDWSAGKKHGSGKYTWSNGGEVNGIWLQDILVSGKINKISGDIDNYAGEIVNGKPHGFGVRDLGDDFLSVKDLYIGEWKQGKKNGWGIWHFKNGDVYEGMWVDDQRNGQGTVTFMDGSEYTGSWSNNYPHGKGTFLLADQFTLKGEWRFGKLVKEQGDQDQTIIPEQRRKEIEKLKDKDFYHDPLISKLGWSKLDIVKKYGIPSQTLFNHYSYRDLGLAFTFSHTEDVVKGLSISGRKNVLGFRLGEMNFSEIENIIGKAHYRQHGYIPSCDPTGSRMNIFLGDYRDNIGELDLYFGSYGTDEDAIASWMTVTWNLYEW